MKRVSREEKVRNRGARALFSGMVLTLIPLALAFGIQAEEATEAAGAKTYEEYCSSCHGTDLKGGNGSSLVDGEWSFGSDLESIRANISKGIVDRGMPAFEELLTSHELDEVARFVQSAAERGAEAGEEEVPSTLRTLDYEVNVEVFASGLEIPWAIDFIDEKTALITERPGRLRLVDNGVLLPQHVAGTPEVLHAGQGGLMDVAIDPEYSENGWIYLSYSHGLASEEEERRPAMTRVVRGRIKDNRWSDEEVVFEAEPESYRTTRHHYGSRIVFDRQGFLYFSIGDRGAGEHAQDLGRPNGKIHRLHRDGSIPRDNPFVGQAGALESIWSWGHRNPQGLAVHPETGRIWDAEHAPRGGDELNLVQKGENYGWPVISYGINYNGTVLTDLRRQEGMLQPNLYWRPSIAVCGIDFYDGDLFPYWKNHLLVAALAFEEVRLLNIVDDRVIHQEVILKDAGRVREAVTGPDGAIYVVLNDPDVVVRLTPAGEWNPI